MASLGTYRGLASLIVQTANDDLEINARKLKVLFGPSFVVMASTGTCDNMALYTVSAFMRAYFLDLPQPPPPPPAFCVSNMSCRRGTDGSFSPANWRMIHRRGWQQVAIWRSGGNGVSSVDLRPTSINTNQNKTYLVLTTTSRTIAISDPIFTSAILDVISHVWVDL